MRTGPHWGGSDGTIRCHLRPNLSHSLTREGLDNRKSATRMREEEQKVDLKKNIYHSSTATGSTDNHYPDDQRGSGFWHFVSPFR
jgi:hypothetical protein